MSATTETEIKILLRTAIPAERLHSRRGGVAGYGTADSLRATYNGEDTILQTYLDTTDVKLCGYIHGKLKTTEFSECRVRSTTVHDGSLNHTLFTLTVKTSGDVTRTEVEELLTADEYNELLAYPQLGIVHKTRHSILYPALNSRLEYDVFLDKLSGLYILECEYDSTVYTHEHVWNTVSEWLLQFMPADQFLDVTEDRRYKNKQLCTDGVPQDKDVVVSQ